MGAALRFAKAESARKCDIPDKLGDVAEPTTSASADKSSRCIGESGALTIDFQYCAEI